MVCEYCGTTNGDRARFCRSCRRLIVLQAQQPPRNQAGTGWPAENGRQGRQRLMPPPAQADLTVQPGRVQAPPPYPQRQTLPLYPAPAQRPAPYATVAQAPHQPEALTSVRSLLDPVPYSIDPQTGLAYDPQYRQPHLPDVRRAGEPAAFFQRLGALLVDYCILSMLWFCALVFATIIDSAAIGMLATFLGPAIYFISFWSTSGRTPGYRAAGLQLVRTDGSPVGLGTSIVRYLGSLLSWPFFFVGYLWMLWDPRAQTWHDKIADTTVVQS